MRCGPLLFLLFGISSAFSPLLPGDHYGLGKWEEMIGCCFLSGRMKVAYAGIVKARRGIPGI